MRKDVLATLRARCIAREQAAIDEAFVLCTEHGIGPPDWLLDAYLEPKNAELMAQGGVSARALRAMVLFDESGAKTNDAAAWRGVANKIKIEFKLDRYGPSIAIKDYYIADRYFRP